MPGGDARLGYVERALARLVRWLARHWLAGFLLGSGVFIALPLAAPLLAATGHDRASSAIYVAYRITCHQLPQRSWFIGGTAPAYDWATIRAIVGAPENGELLLYHRPIRDPVLGYQVAFCQRDSATYLTLFLTAVAYGLVRRRHAVKALSLRLYALALVPIGVDGLLQLVGVHESTPLSRTLTGALFGVATGLLVLPQLDEGMREVSDEPGSLSASSGAAVGEGDSAAADFETP